ncbi:MAG: ABC transporter ATP-binding protein/permease [Peptostreptococcus sp.]|nr:ABC transporter ATP-binding protein/permease [Peptostreptococcus sp.]
MVEKNLFQFCGNTKRYIIEAVLINYIRLVANITFSFMFASVLAHFITGVYVFNPKISYILIGLSLLVRQICIRAVTRKNNLVVYEVKQNLRKAIYSKVLSLGSLYQEKMTTQEIVHLGVEGVEQLENYYGSYLTQFYYSFISTFVLFLVIAPINFKIAIVLLVLAPIIPLFLLLILKIVKNVQKKYWSKYADVGNLFLDSLQGLTTLKVFRADEARGKELDEMSEGFRKETMRVLSMQLNSIMIIDWIAYGGAVAGIVVALNEFVALHIDIYQIILVLLLIADFFVPMRTLTSLFHVAMTGVTASEKMLEFLNEDTNIENGSHTFEKKSPISVKSMNYYYPDGTHALKDINMSFEPGSLTALVGPSGCGKTTVCALIPRFYDVSEGGIFVDGKNIKDFSLYSLRNNIGIVQQDVYLFSGTIMENIRYGKPDATEEEIIEAAKLASAYDFIMELEEGFDTYVGERGVKLSGGQKQRISIARVFLKNPPILILDEATSALDNNSEAVIQESLEVLSKGRTTITIAHRLTTIQNADMIVVMTADGIVEKGSHEELMENKAYYYNLYTKAGQ